MADLNGMEREVLGVTGDIGIEVLPYVHVIFGGLDEVGQELIGNVQERVNWIAEKKWEGGDWKAGGKWGEGE